MFRLALALLIASATAITPMKHTGTNHAQADSTWAPTPPKNNFAQVADE